MNGTPADEPLGMGREDGVRCQLPPGDHCVGPAEEHIGGRIRRETTGATMGGLLLRSIGISMLHQYPRDLEAFEVILAATSRR